MGIMDNRLVLLTASFISAKPLSTVASHYLVKFREAIVH